MGEQRGDDAFDALYRSVVDGLGPDAPQQLAQAQARIAWSEVVGAAGLEQGTMSSRLTGVSGDGVGHVEASESILAQELTLRAEALVWAVNRQMAGRPGATIELRRLAVSVSRSGGRRDL
jgi:hypothetical protein